MADEKVLRKWYSGMFSSEDWWAVWLGLAMVVFGLASLVGVDLVGWVAIPVKWTEPAKGLKLSGAAYQGIHPLVGLAANYLIFTALVTLGAWAMKWNVKKFFLGWTVIFIITWICWFAGHNVHLAAMENEMGSFGISWSLNMGDGASYLLALALGLFIGNVTKGLAAFLKDAAKPEWFIKTAIVYLGVKLGVKCMSAAGFAIDLALAGAAATVVAYMLFWPISYLIARKAFKMSRDWAACLASGVSICGISAAVATGGAIRARTFIPVVVSILVVVCTIFMIVGLPPIFTGTLMDEPMVAGSAVGMTVKTDGGDAATGAILDDMMRSKASQEGTKWEEGWILTAAVMTKIWIDIFIGIWAFLLALLWVYKVEKKPGQARVPLSEIWFRFPKFVLGYLIAWFAYVAVSFISPDAIAAAKIGAGPVQHGMRHLFFMLTFVSIGVITNFRKLKGIGKPAIVYVIMQFLIIPPLALLIAWIFHHGMMPPVVGG